MKDKLSNSHVNNIYQDRHGYIWVCTDNGLNVFDGSDFRTYYHRQNDSTSLVDNSVLAVLEDKAGNFWVGTTAGLQLFNRDTEQFSNIRFSYPRVTDFSYFSCILEDSKGNIWVSTSRSGAICLRAGSHQPIYYMQTNSNICSNKINTLFEDRFGNIWIGSQDNGISILNVQNHTLVNYSYNAQDPNSLSSNKVYSVLENADGNILVGTIDGGINLFNYADKRFTRNYIPAGNIVFTMKRGNKNNLWIGTDGLGLKSYDYSTKKITTYETDLNTVDLRKAKVHCVLQDNQGNLWIALYQDGILMIPDKKKVFRNIGYNPFYQEKSIGSECVLSVLEDSNGKVWVGTDGDGIYRLDSQRKVEKHYGSDKLNASVILSIFEDSQKRIWIGTYLYGLFLYNSGSDSFLKVPLVVDGRDVKDINVVKGDNHGNLWIGTNENGLCVYNPATKQIRSYTYDLLKTGNQIPSNSVQTILLDGGSRVWIGTSSAGLSCLNPTTNTFSEYKKENGKLNNNNITVIAKDRQSNIWVGTKQGLHCIDLKKGTVKLYTEADGLANSSITGIEIDKHDNLWISTSLGLSHFNRLNHSFINYYVSDGLINDEYRRGAYYQSKAGELFFGGTEGLSSFFPFKIEESAQLKNLVFTNLFIYNEKVEIGENSYLKKNINAAEEITIDHNIKSFSLGFAALEYNNPGKVVYQVKMEGFDNDWKTLPMGSKLATYTNLRYGKYKFYIRAYLPNSEPIERSITVVVLPPFWLSWWAKLIYSLMILAAGYWVYKRMQQSLEQRNDELQKENEKQIMQSKLQFFTDISHEIRTPLTLILTPIEKLIKETPDGTLRNTYKLINQNGQRILRLVNQIMEMRKLDRGQVKLSASETDVQEFVREIVSSFDNVITERKCEFNLDFAPDLPKVWMDHEKMDKVIFNVLSNAFKYTPKKGKISLVVDTYQGDLRIRISDSGPGIPEDQRETIFNRFYQIKNDSNYNKIGTGIGLHLSRSLIEIHHGKIYVNNSAESGACFVICIPLDNSYLNPDEIAESPKMISLAEIVQPSLGLDLSDEREQEQVTQQTNRFKFKVLVVEDNKDIRSYIADILSKDYQIIQADNGNAGLELAIRELPDCVITDVMMDGLDGIELCKKIKTNEKTCHIPVIILTAKTSIEQRVEGLEVGADSYIPKPFNISHLKVRISKLIELRQTIKNKYEGKFEVPQEQIKVKSVDEKLFEKFENIVKDQLDNPDLSIEIISQQIGISRSQLQRKLKQITNQNPSDYLKTMRLRYAGVLLTSKNLSISEVTYACGFALLSHFSNSFREFYGMSPSRYVEINKNKQIENEIEE
ncbi:MAG: two-component regulator propeller domain-containing protein [Paludibacter sp.]